MLFVHHTDAEREGAYDPRSPIGRLDKGLGEATPATEDSMERNKKFTGRTRKLTVEVTCGPKCSAPRHA
jgi:hypothetical protein